MLFSKMSVYSNVQRYMFREDYTYNFTMAKVTH